MIVDEFKKLIDNNMVCFTDDEMGLFRDSVRGIYRSTYIMAYQGMMIYFRRLVMNSDMPKGFDTTKWKVMQRFCLDTPLQSSRC